MTFRDWGLRSLFIGLLMLTVGACGTIGGDGNVPFGSLGQRVAESVIPVSDENRDLRVCWLAAGAVEVITDLAQRGGAAEAGRALGHLVMLQGAIGKASLSDSFWIETDTADVSLIFAVVLKDLGKTRLSQILLGGPTISNFLNVAKRTIVLTVKGNAAMRDINRVLQGVEDGIIDKADAFKACEDRTLMNGDVLRALTGGHTVSSTETFAPALAEGWLDEKAFIAEGWRDEKQMIAEGWGGEHDVFPYLASTQTVEYDFITSTETMILMVAGVDRVVIGVGGHQTEVIDDSILGGRPIVGLDLDREDGWMRGGDDEIIMAKKDVFAGPMDGDVYPDGWMVACAAPNVDGVGLWERTIA